MTTNSRNDGAFGGTYDAQANGYHSDPKVYLTSNGRNGAAYAGTLDAQMQPGRNVASTYAYTSDYQQAPVPK